MNIRAAKLRGVQAAAEANNMIWSVLCGCKKGSISDYAAEIGVTDEDLDAAYESLKS